MNTVQSKDGTNIVYDRRGSGPVIITISGAMSSRSFIGTVQLAELLAPHFTVISYDRRGHGDSGDHPPYAVEREIEDLAAVIAAAGGEAFIYGHSSGAVIALEAASNVLAIKKLALYEPPYVGKDSPNRPPADAAAQITALTQAGRRSDAVDYFMTQVIGVPAEFVTPMHDTPMWPGLEEVAHTTAYDITMMGDWSVPARFAAITIPALVLDGANSPPMLHDAAQAVTDTLPNARRISLPAQGHDVAPATIAPILAEFFTS